jgi:hypothetical protein
VNVDVINMMLDNDYMVIGQIDISADCASDVFMIRGKHYLRDRKKVGRLIRYMMIMKMVILIIVMMGRMMVMIMMRSILVSID